MCENKNRTNVAHISCAASLRIIIIIIIIHKKCINESVKNKNDDYKKKRAVIDVR